MELAWAGTDGAVLQVPGLQERRRLQLHRPVLAHLRSPAGLPHPLRGERPGRQEELGQSGGWRQGGTGHVNWRREVLTARGGSLCSLQHVALCVKLIAAWYVPNVPQSVKNKFRVRKHNNLRKELRWVMPQRCRGRCAEVLLQRETCRAAGPSLQSPMARPTMATTGVGTAGLRAPALGELLHHLFREASPPALSPATTWGLQQTPLLLR